ncbi:MAG: hypothetical protein J1F35_08125 [Erysipelotrichales bacterium]|nr:hypothetical protein [Erysipelotrichales bacterium]
MEKCFEDLQNEIREEIKYRLDNEELNDFIFENDDLSVELHIDTEWNGEENVLTDLSFGYFESDVYPYHILSDNLYEICENLVFYLS